MAQILVNQLIDKVEGLQEELAQSRRTTNSLTLRLVGTTRKHHASPVPNSSDDEDCLPHRPRNPEQTQHDRSPIPTMLEITTQQSPSPIYHEPVIR